MKKERGKRKRDRDREGKSLLREPNRTCFPIFSRPLANAREMAFEQERRRSPAIYVCLASWILAGFAGHADGNGAGQTQTRRHLNILTLFMPK